MLTSFNVMAKEIKMIPEREFTKLYSGYQSIDASDLDNVWSNLSERGLPIAFNEGDTITFGKNVRAVPFVTTNGTETHVGHIAAWTERFGWFWFPLSTFRRTPIEEERDVLFSDQNEFGRKLLLSMKDIDRARAVTERTVLVSGVAKLHRYAFDREKNGPDYDRKLPLTCYMFKEVAL